MADLTNVIQYYKGLNGTPALLIALRAWLDLINTGYSGWYLPLDDSINEALVAFDTEKPHVPIGIIIFQKEDDGCYFLDTGWIDPEYRGKGIYSLLWDKLVQRAKDENVPSISSWIVLQNTKMIDLAKKQGRTTRLMTDRKRKRTLIESTYLINR